MFLGRPRRCVLRGAGCREIGATTRGHNKHRVSRTILLSSFPGGPESGRLSARFAIAAIDPGACSSIVMTLSHAPKVRLKSSFRTPARGLWPIVPRPVDCKFTAAARDITGPFRGSDHTLVRRDSHLGNYTRLLCPPRGASFPPKTTTLLLRLNREGREIYLLVHIDSRRPRAGADKQSPMSVSACLTLRHRCWQ